MSPETRRIAFARTKGLCACGCGRRADQLHHVLPRQRWEHLSDHPMCVVALAALCHMRHESGYRRLPRHLTDLALEWCATSEADVAFLERVYVDPAETHLHTDQSLGYRKIAAELSPSFLAALAFGKAVG